MFFKTYLYFPLRDTAFGSVPIKNALRRAGLAPLNRGIAIGRVKDEHSLSFEAVNPFTEDPTQEDESVAKTLPEVPLPKDLLSRNWRSVRATLLGLGLNVNQVEIYQACWKLNAELRAEVANLKALGTRLQNQLIRLLFLLEHMPYFLSQESSFFFNESLSFLLSK